jgi:hypothetical protein
MAVIHAPSSAIATTSLVTQAAPTRPPISLLLVEPQFLLRRTVAAVARDMRLAHPQEITTVEAAARLLSVRSFDALFLSLDEGDRAIDLMQRVRAGDTECAATVPIAVTAESCDTSLALRLKTLDVRRLLLRPFKVKGVLDAIGALRQTPTPEATTLPRAA